MSFLLPPTGYAQTQIADQIGEVPLALGSSVTTVCTGVGVQGDITCHIAQGFAPPLQSYDLASVLAELDDIPDALYSIRIYYRTPKVKAGSTGCNHGNAFVGPSCTGQARDLTIFIYGVTLATAYDGSTIPNPSTTPDATYTDWELEGWVVNPTPTYPVPDTYGNNVGTLLFARDDIPATIDCGYTGTWVDQMYGASGFSEEPFAGTRTVTITRYDPPPGGEPPETPNFMCLL